MNPGVWMALGTLVAVLGSCTPEFREPTRVEAPAGHLDLQTWNFDQQGPVLLTSWLWDADVLWSPVDGRPETLPPPQAQGSPDRGGTLRSEGTHAPGRVPTATARLTIRVNRESGYSLRIGSFPGALRVWTNSVLVWSSGVVSSDSSAYRPAGAGTALTVQPTDGTLDLVVEIASDDPLVRHFEMNRLWVLGGGATLVAADRTEEIWRCLQATILGIGLVVFLWIARFPHYRRTLAAFSGFLAVSLGKLVVNVEQPQPLLSTLIPGVPQGFYLLATHGLNFWPFPLFLLFLHRQFPEEVSFCSVKITTVSAVVITVWELLPFAFLGFRWVSGYDALMQFPWSLVLNLYAVGITLYTFERMYQIHQRRRPLSGSLFFGGIGLGLIILIPILLSFFMPVKHTYFLGWGLFLYLIVLSLDLIRLQVQSSHTVIQTLEETVHRKERLGKFIATSWASLFQRDSLEALEVTDQRSVTPVIVQVRCPGALETWISRVGPLATARHAILVETRESTATWVLDAWSETAIAFALEVRARLGSETWPTVQVALVRAALEVRILDLDALWVPVASGLPYARLEALASVAERYGASIVLDESLQDGLVIGGWNRHRHFTAEGTEIELYEAESETLANLKDKTLNLFEDALAQYRQGDTAAAVQTLFDVVRNNPFDQGAKVLLEEWGKA